MTDNINQLRALAQQVRNYQLERDWSDAKLCKEVAHVGSTKTYKRILDAEDELDELNVETQLRNYQAAVEFITALRTKDRPAEPEYEDFANIMNVRAAVGRALLEDEDCVARLVIVEGNTATGKDAVRRNLQKVWPNITVVVEANELWRDSLAVPARAIYNAVGIVKQKDKETKEAPKPPRYPAEIIGEVIASLRERKLVLIINEAHHLGPRGLNMVKTLLNQTPTVIVLECIPALLTRLLSGSYEEAIQLTGNRLCERVYLAPPPADEILLMLERRGVKFADVEAKNTAAKTLAEEAPNFGNWRYVTQVTRKLVDASKRAPVTLKSLSLAASEVRNMRTRIIKQREA
jgi:hypothetical protein